MIKIKNNTTSLDLFSGDTFESVEEMRSMVSDWLLEGGMESAVEREEYIDRWMEEVSYEEVEEDKPYQGYVRIREQYFLQLPTPDGGFEICDDDQTWPSGFGIANGKEIEPVDESEVPEEDRERLEWILSEALAE